MASYGGTPGKLQYNYTYKFYLQVASTSLALRFVMVHPVNNINLKKIKFECTIFI